MSNDALRQAIADEVRAEMARKRRTQREMAALLNVDQPSISLRLRGERSFRAEELRMVADWLGVPVDRFIGESSVGIAS